MLLYTSGIKTDHLDRQGNLSVHLDHLKSPIDRRELSSNINQSSSVSSIKTCEKHHVQGRPRRNAISQVATKGKVSFASGTKTGKKPIVEIFTHSDATTNSEIIVSSETTENSTGVKIKIKPGHGIKCIRINFGTDERNDDRNLLAK